MAASPIPLSAASFLNSKPEPPAFPDMFNGGDESLAMMSMDDLTAIISGGDFGGNANLGLGLNMPIPQELEGLDQSQTQVQSNVGQSQAQNQTSQVQQSTQNQSIDPSAMTPTSSLLATLGGGTSPTKQADQPPPANEQFDFNFSEDDLANLDLSSFSMFNEGGDATSGDGGLSAFQSFMNDQEKPAEAVAADAPKKEEETTAPAPAPEPQASKSQPQAEAQPQQEEQQQQQQQQQPQEQKPPQETQQQAADPQVQTQTEPPAEPFEAGGDGDFDFSEYNFGDGMPNVDGDDFASIFAEFK